MISLIYGFIQLLAFFVFLPKLVLRWVLYKDRSLLGYLGFCLPKAKISKELCFLLYAVSVGEVKAFASLFHKMKQEYPTASFYIACRTTTGLEEAKRSLLAADDYFLLPFDFLFLSKKLMNRISPDAVFVMEGDLWYNFLKTAKDRGSFLCLISGKISLRSYRRFSCFPFFSRRLFSLFTLICAQNSIFAKRFVDLGAVTSAVLVTGNIKLESKREFLKKEDKEALERRLGIETKDFVLVIGSTHAKEEEEIMKVLQPLWKKYPHMKCLIVPRHQKRFSEVKQMLTSHKLSFDCFSDLNERTGKEKILLIDEMGLLADFYQLADIAIVGGSFDKSLRGHNILEPIQAGVPPLFGPHMESQTDLVDLVLSFQAGIQVDLSHLVYIVECCMKDPSFLFALRGKGKNLLSSLQGASLRTWVPVQSHIASIR